MGNDTEALRQDIESTRANMSETLDAIGDRVIPGRVMERNKNRVANRFQSARDRVMGTASSAQGSVAGAAHSLTDRAGEATATLRHSPDAVVERTEGSPMVAGALAFGVGFLVAAIFPPSQAERALGERAREAAQPIREEVMAATHEVAEHLREPVQSAASTVKDSISESAQTVGDEAKSAVQEAKSNAQGAAATVQETAKGAQASPKV